MKKTFRQSMAWLHTWSGLVLGWLLFAIFLTGTIAFFRQEITYWMQPELHSSVPTPQSADLAVARLQTLAPQAEYWRIDLPLYRERTVNVAWQEYGVKPAGRRGGPRETLNAATGEVLQPRDTRGGSFLYRFHFELYAMDRNTARAIVGIATMFMLVAIISGIITHKKIFAEFFTFRAKKSQRSWLDAHVATAVLALPFHLMITFSGLLLVSSTLLFWNYEPRGPRQSPEVNRQQAGPITHSIPELAPLLAQAKQRWQQPVGRIQIDQPGTEKMHITLSSGTSQSLSTRGGGGGGSDHAMEFDANGALLDSPAGRPNSTGAVRAVYNTFGTLHRARFAQPVLRWLFFASGVLGTLMIATGLVLWCVKRGRKKLGNMGYRFVSIMNVANIAGLCCAVGVYFWANRLIPASWPTRADWEVSSFFAAWAAMLILAIWRHDAKGWLLQIGFAALLFLLLPVLGSLTSTVSVAQAWADKNWMLLGFDAISLATGAGLALAAWHLKKPVPVAKPRKVARARQKTMVSAEAKT